MSGRFEAHHYETTGTICKQRVLSLLTAMRDEVRWQIDLRN
ncbi:MAG TPA: hypothetical protein VK581_01655 [Chthoniobacterales bacterium]|nr:hypothetical protein [Chthoniobacterales bacterium]